MTPQDLTIMQTIIWILEAALRTISSPTAKSRLQTCMEIIADTLREELSQ